MKISSSIRLAGQIEKVTQVPFLGKKRGVCVEALKQPTHTDVVLLDYLFDFFLNLVVGMMGYHLCQRQRGVLYACTCPFFWMAV